MEELRIDMEDLKYGIKPKVVIIIWTILLIPLALIFDWHALLIYIIGFVAYAGLVYLLGRNAPIPTYIKEPEEGPVSLADLYGQEWIYGSDRVWGRLDGKNQRKADALRRRAKFEDYYLDKNYRQEVARNRYEEMLSEHKKEWTDAYNDIMGDRFFKELLEKEYPDVIEWLEALIDVLRLSERERTRRSAAPSRPRPSHSEDVERLAREHAKVILTAAFSQTEQLMRLQGEKELVIVREGRYAGCTDIEAEMIIEMYDSHIAAIMRGTHDTTSYNEDKDEAGPRIT